MSTVTFKQGDYNVENLQKVISQGGVKIEDTYILLDGSIVYLKGDSWVPMDQMKFVTPEQAKYIAEKVFEKSIQKRSEEGFQEIDSKTPVIYDLEKRIREINGEEEIPLEKMERLMETYDIEAADQILRTIYPNGFRLTMYTSVGKIKTGRSRSSRKNGGTQQLT